ncbi:hypothetical protein GCM10023334_096570 [Nonomuraea thailandensis]
MTPEQEGRVPRIARGDAAFLLSGRLRAAARRLRGGSERLRAAPGCPGLLSGGFGRITTPTAPRPRTGR